MLRNDNYEVHSVYFVLGTRMLTSFQLSLLTSKQDGLVVLSCQWSVERYGICIFIGILRPTERRISVVHARDPPILLYSSLMFVCNPFEHGSKADCHKNY